jgi:hypothetical protein
MNKEKNFTQSVRIAEMRKITEIADFSGISDYNLLKLT